LEEIAAFAGDKVYKQFDLYFADCWQSTRDFRPGAQALPNPLITYYYSIN